MLPTVKNKDLREEYLELEILSKPVVLSSEAPVAETYLLYASVAMRIKVVPVSTIPAVSGRMFVEEPNWMFSPIPQKSLAGEIGAD